MHTLVLLLVLCIEYAYCSMHNTWHGSTTHTTTLVASMHSNACHVHNTNERKKVENSPISNKARSFGAQTQPEQVRWLGNLKEIILP
jgi:hypothetical protein